MEIVRLGKRNPGCPGCRLPAVLDGLYVHGKVSACPCKLRRRMTGTSQKPIQPLTFVSQSLRPIYVHTPNRVNCKMQNSKRYYI